MRAKQNAPNNLLLVGEARDSRSINEHLFCILFCPNERLNRSEPDLSAQYGNLSMNALPSSRIFTAAALSGASSVQTTLSSVSEPAFLDASLELSLTCVGNYVLILVSRSRAMDLASLVLVVARIFSTCVRLFDLSRG